ncbi:hypothetical protein DL765_010495 [Monosporascus sp. GIB2]|nr:hypothetical protein DL765_010495 [Monosporascus sp. GIB2]
MPYVANRQASDCLFLETFHDNAHADFAQNLSSSPGWVLTAYGVARSTSFVADPKQRQVSCVSNAKVMEGHNDSGIGCLLLLAPSPRRRAKPKSLHLWQEGFPACCLHARYKAAGPAITRAASRRLLIVAAVAIARILSYPPVNAMPRRDMFKPLSRILRGRRTASPAPTQPAGMLELTPTVSLLRADSSAELRSSEPKDAENGPKTSFSITAEQDAPSSSATNTRVTRPFIDASHADHQRPVATTQSPPPAQSVEIQAGPAATKPAEQRTHVVPSSPGPSSTAPNNVKMDGAEHSHSDIKPLEKVLSETHEPFADGRVERQAPTVQTSERVELTRTSFAQPRSIRLRPITDKDLGIRVLYDGTHITPQPEAGNPVKMGAYPDNT